MNIHLRQGLKQVVHYLLSLSVMRLTALFVTVAVLVSMIIVSIIDFSWDGRFNAELEFAGVITPFLDGLLIVGLLAVLLSELREEVGRRKAAEDAACKLSGELEAKVQERTKQLLEMQEELVHKEKLAVLGQVADTVGHELRNPLGVMNNAVYYLQAKLAGADESIREYLDIMKEEIADAERIVSDLLDAVRIKQPHPERVDVTEAIALALRKCNIPPSVSVRLSIPQAMPAVRVDPMHLHQVLWNLIINAVEAMPQGGALTIQTEEDEPAHALCISIEDSGIGIAPDQQARLFQPLFTTKARRIGLGLVVVKNLTQANGGTVRMRSEPGRGSVFSITLPCRGMAAQTE